MAQMVTLQILGTPKETFTAAQTWAFPVSAFVASPVQAGTSVPAGTDSVVLVAPTGLNQPARVFFCSATVVEIAAAANAPLA
jgi:hypothetical protein